MPTTVEASGEDPAAIAARTAARAAIAPSLEELRWATEVYDRARGRVAEDVALAAERYVAAGNASLREALREALGDRGRLQIRALDPEGTRFEVSAALRVLVPRPSRGREGRGVAGDCYTPDPSWKCRSGSRLSSERSAGSPSAAAPAA